MSGLKQRGITIRRRIGKDKNVAKLYKRLQGYGDTLQESLQDQNGTSMDRVERLHFFSCIIEPRKKSEGPPYVILELNYDGNTNRFLIELAEKSKTLLDLMFSECEGYPTSGSVRAIVKWLQQGEVRSNVFYVGNLARSRTQITQEQGLLSSVKAVAADYQPKASSRHDLGREIRQRMRSRYGDFVRNPPPRPLRVRWTDSRGSRRLRGILWWSVRLVFSVVGLLAAGELAYRYHTLLVTGIVFVIALWVAAVSVREIPKNLKVRRLPRMIYRQFLLRFLWTTLQAAIVVGLVMLVAGASLEFTLRVVEQLAWMVVAIGSVLLLAGVAVLSWLVLGWFWASVVMAVTSGIIRILFVLDTPRAYLVALVLAAVLVLGLIVRWFLRRLPPLRDQERSDLVFRDSPDHDQLNEIKHRELRQGGGKQQNHLASVVDIKPGSLRLYMLKAVLRLVQAAHILYFNKGRLADISSIHFARWAILPPAKNAKSKTKNGKSKTKNGKSKTKNGKSKTKNGKLLFLTNYDGNFEGYLGEFHRVEGVTGIWGNTIGFPQPFLLFWDGARIYQDYFKNHALKSQSASLIWYSAYPTLNVQDIDLATRVREALARPLDSQMRGTLWRLLNDPVDDAELERLRAELNV